MPTPWNGMYSTNRPSKKSGAIPAVSRPLIRAEIIVKAIVHAYTQRRPPNTLFARANKMITIVNGYKSINTGMAALMIVFKPNILRPNAATEKITTYNL